MDRIYQLTDEAVGLHAQLKSKTLTAVERKQLTTDLEETLALCDYLQKEYDRQILLSQTWTPEELEPPPESELMRGPIGAGGGLSRRARM
jgi:hypothetical protein